MANLDKNAAFAELDDLLDASMDDLEGLPPIGVPPTGHYNFFVDAKTGEVAEKDAVILTWEVAGVNEVKEESEAGEVKVGQTFNENFILKTKKGEPNTTSIGALKARLEPFAIHYNIDPSARGAIRESISKMQRVMVAATVRRVPQKDNPEMFNARISDVVIL